MIELIALSIRAGQFSLNGVSFRVESGEYAVLMGTTGSGKTTVLEAICGLKRVTSGCLLIQSTDVTNWSPGDRQIGYVPQDHALFPTLTVQEHLEFALRIKRQPTALIRQRSKDLADMLGITHLRDRRVTKLSGGESQRVALGRALSFRPSVLLLDEPLSALDEQTRHEMQTLLRTVKESTGVTTLHVTHSLEEANALADRRFVLEAGAVREV